MTTAPTPPAYSAALSHEQREVGTASIVLRPVTQLLQAGSQNVGEPRPSSISALRGEGEGEGEGTLVLPGTMQEEGAPGG